ncbi:MAG TPA: VOC family protein [Acidimicrobiales bacterium]|nr:VOC family protein [Acidimicrobiales bacterium]
MAHLAALSVVDRPELWADLGFAVSGDDALVGTVTVTLGRPGGPPGITGWTLAGVDHEAAALELDGVPTTVLDAPPPPNPGRHPNAVTAIDHVVVTTPDLERTVEALGRLGIHERRRRDAGRPGGASMTQVFFRLGEVILELVGPPEPSGDGPARLWGLAFLVSDLEQTAAYLGPRLRPARAAVQPGRFIATLDRSAGSAVDIAFMS